MVMMVTERAARFSALNAALLRALALRATTTTITSPNNYCYHKSVYKVRKKVSKRAVLTLVVTRALIYCINVSGREITARKKQNTTSDNLLLQIH